MRFTRKYQKILFSLLFVSFIFGIVLGISLITDTDLSSGFTRIFADKHVKTHDRKEDNHPTHGMAVKNVEVHEKTYEKIDKPTELKTFAKQNKSHQDPKRAQQFQKATMEPSVLDNNVDELQDRLSKMPKANYNAHIFYYPWYGNPKVDGNYIHWNHVYMPHWDKKEAERWPKGKHKPPHDIGSNFYPELGPYSSRDATVLDSHMQQIRSAGIGEYALYNKLYFASLGNHCLCS